MARRSSNACLDGAVDGALRGCSRGCMVFIPLIFTSSFTRFFSSIHSFHSLSEIATSLILDYQANISPKLETNCLFEPSCSNYAIGAIEKYGLLKGLAKGFLRILRCNPLNSKLEKIEDIP